MLKLWTVFLLVILIGCSEVDEIDKERTIFDQSELVSNQIFEFEVLNSYRTFSDNPYYLEDGYLYVVVNIKIKNISDEKQSINAFNWKMRNDQGIEVDATWLSSFGGNSFNGELLPNGEIEGFLVFEQPINNSGLKLAYYDSPFNENPSFLYEIDCDCSVEPLNKDKFETEEVVVYNDVQYRIVNILRSDGSDFYKPENGYQYLGVVLNTVNLSLSNISVNSNNWKIIDANGVQYDSTYFSPFEEIDYPSTNLLSQGEVSGIIVFEVPKEMGLLFSFYRDPYNGGSQFSYVLD